MCTTFSWGKEFPTTGGPLPSDCPHTFQMSCSDSGRESAPSIADASTSCPTEIEGTQFAASSGCHPTWANSFVSDGSHPDSSTSRGSRLVTQTTRDSTLQNFVTHNQSDLPFSKVLLCTQCGLATPDVSGSSGIASTALPCELGKICVCPRTAKPRSARQAGFQNEFVWKDALVHVEKYLDVRSMLMLRQTGRFFYKHKYAPENGVLRFGAFRGALNFNLICETVIPLACLSLKPSLRRSGLSLDFSKCSMVRDSSVALICESFHGGARGALGNLRALKLDFCHRLTDKGLEALLTTNLPYLECLTLRCARSKNLTGSPFQKYLRKADWPRFAHFSCAFTNMWLEPVKFVADYIRNRAVVTALRTPCQCTNESGEGETVNTPHTEKSSESENCGTVDSNSRNQKCQTAGSGDLSPLRKKQGKDWRRRNDPRICPTILFPHYPTSQPSQPRQQSRCHSMRKHTPSCPYASADICGGRGGACWSLEVTGSWASKCLLESLNLSTLVSAFCKALHDRNMELVARLSKVARQKVADAEERFLASCPSQLPSTGGRAMNALLHAIKGMGSDLIVNIPMTCPTSEEGGVNVWTLPLSVATEWPDINIVKLLQKRGACVDVWDYLGKSPLVRACELRRPDLVAYFLNAGVSPNPADWEGHVPLNIAVRKQSLPIGELLLKSGASLEPAFMNGHLKGCRPPLYVACESNSTSEIIQMLLDRGADPNWSAENMRLTPALLAVKSDCHWLVPFLDAGAGVVQGKEWVLMELLSLAVSKGHVECVKILIDRFGHLLCRDHSIWSFPLIQAARLGRSEVLQVFLDNGCDANQVSNDSSASSAMHVAAEEGHCDCVAALIRHGGNTDAVNSYGQTPLHLACLENRVSVAKVVLEGRANVNITDSLCGETPLMSCIRARHDQMASTLIDLATSLDTNVEDSMGRTALAYSILYGQYAIADKLMERGAIIPRHESLDDDPTFALAMERMAASGADKRVLRRFMRLYKARVDSVSMNITQANESDCGKSTERSDHPARSPTLPRVLSRLLSILGSKSEKCPSRPDEAQRNCMPMRWRRKRNTKPSDSWDNQRDESFSMETSFPLRQYSSSFTSSSSSIGSAASFTHAGGPLPQPEGSSTPRRALSKLKQQKDGVKRFCF